MNDSDLEIYILEAKEKNKNTKIVSILEPYKDVIFKMLDGGLNMKQVHNYLILKYDVSTSYYNLTKWCKRHQKENKKVDFVVDKAEDINKDMTREEKVRFAQKRAKNRKVV